MLRTPPCPRIRRYPDKGDALPPPPRNASSAPRTPTTHPPRPGPAPPTRPEIHNATGDCPTTRPAPQVPLPRGPHSPRDHRSITPPETALGRSPREKRATSPYPRDPVERSAAALAKTGRPQAFQGAGRRRRRECRPRAFGTRLLSHDCARRHSPPPAPQRPGE